MLGEKFATRLNSFASKPEIFWKSDIPPLTPEKLIERASTVNGLTNLDLNYPDHSKDNLNEILKIMNANGLGINGFAMRYYTNSAFKLGAFTNPDKKSDKKQLI